MTIKDLDLEIYGPWYRPIWQSPYFWLIIVTLLAVLGYLVYWLYHKYFNHRRATTDNLAPNLRALRDLQVLLREIPQIERSADFYSQLVAIMKKYLASQFTGAELLAKTDLELFNFLQTHAQLTHGQIDLLAELLTARAKARFAALTFDQALARHDLYRCHEFVESLSKPKSPAENS